MKMHGETMEIIVHIYVRSSDAGQNKQLLPH